jgi:hypothetical protein
VSLLHLRVLRPLGCLWGSGNYRTVRLNSDSCIRVRSISSGSDAEVDSHAVVASCNRIHNNLDPICISGRRSLLLGDAALEDLRQLLYGDVGARLIITFRKLGDHVGEVDLLTMLVK